MELAAAKTCEDGRNEAPKYKAREIIGVNYFILSLGKIDAASGEFEADFYLDLHWNDKLPKSSDVKGGEMDWKHQWNPNIEFVNARSDNLKVFENYIVNRVEGNANVTHEITYQTRIRGVFSSPMNLRMFPFDLQKLEIHLESGEYLEDELKMTKHPNSSGGNICQALRRDGLVEWSLQGVKDAVETSVLEFDSSKYSRFTMSFVVVRRIEFYMYKIIFPFVGICVMSLSVYGMPIEDVGKRVGVTITAALTATAFQLAAAGDLPKCSYLTSYDKFMTVSFIVIFLTCASNIVSFQVYDNGGEDAARTIDIACLAITGSILLTALFNFLWFGRKWQYSADTNNDGFISVHEYKNMHGNGDRAALALGSR